jgi:hypothetical protein
MKKRLLSFILLSLAATTFAQITVTNNDIAPAGTTIYLANDTTFLGDIIPGEPGANKVWDFTNVQSNTVDTINFILPSSTPFGDAFPNANFAFYSHDIDAGDVYAYMVRSDDKFSTIGYAIDTEEFGFAYNHVEPEDIILDFPVDYQNAYNELITSDMVIASPIPGYDSIRTKSTIVKETIIDAWGSITIPSGTYNSLRQRIDEDETDSTFMMVSGAWIFIDAYEDSSTTYSWWTNDVNIGFILFSLDVDPITEDVYGISFFNGSHVGLNETNIVETKVFPNPASNLLTFEFDKIITGELVLMNQLGQIVAKSSIDGQSNIQLNISNLPTGVYLYHSINNSGELLSSGKILKK